MASLLRQAAVPSPYPLPTLSLRYGRGFLARFRRLTVKGPGMTAYPSAGSKFIATPLMQ